MESEQYVQSRLFQTPLTGTKLLRYLTKKLEKECSFIEPAFLAGESRCFGQGLHQDAYILHVHVKFSTDVNVTRSTWKRTAVYAKKLRHLM